ncbi:MAG: hypothetical protein E7108_01935 [Bacteroidales bacterium]|nr:hypothetical protein [Bacteroidales bacterium]
MADITKIEIGNTDIETTYGVIPQGDFLDQLEKAAPAKDVISNKNAQISGKDVANTSLLLDEKKLTLMFALRANSRATYASRYTGFLAAVMTYSVFAMSVTTSDGKKTTYHFTYEDMSSHKGFNGKWAEFTMKFNEPNPANRQIVSV